MRKCSKRGCQQKHEAKGLCQSHYKKMRWATGGEHRQSYDYMNNWNRSLAGRFSSLRRAANDTELASDITREQHAFMLMRVCEYCRGDLSPTGHGLDRKDSSKGYTNDNVVPCCVSCNRIKNRYLSYKEMKAAMKAVLKVRNSGD